MFFPTEPKIFKSAFFNQHNCIETDIGFTEITEYDNKSLITKSSDAGEISIKSLIPTVVSNELIIQNDKIHECTICKRKFENRIHDFCL